ncbi:type I secretion system permease/ATPase [Brevundimonas sp. 2R-24]|uniref:Type I secretion system permease/ATPase n=1 Tax=Peiella sedimenti TaxID=3061083 RepID=A0ABT8SMB9_9CAUL|nr:type I secretion system permease/ATPase [Caulobacteraceae bacterium XZ-24]
MAPKTETSLFALLKAPGPLGEALRACRRHLLFAAGFSALVNILYLAPTLYMLQVYDRALPTSGRLTLLFVTIVLLFALITMGALDQVRSRLLLRAGLRLERRLAGPVLDRVLSGAGGPARARQAMREFDVLRQMLSGPGALALFDAPWTPVYLIVCFILHPWVGALAVAGAVLLGGLAILNERATRPGLLKAAEGQAAAYATQDAAAQQSEAVRALGMRRALTARQIKERSGAAALQADVQFVGQGYNGAIKFLRMALQSLALGLGALLAIDGQISAGAVIAASVLLSRALQPVEQAVGAWGGIIQGRAALHTIGELLGAAAEAPERTRLPDPKGDLTMEKVVLMAPGREQPVLKGVTFALHPGQILGVVGPSGAGKSSLARAAAGAVRPDSGTVRIDGAAFTDWDPERLARHIGYAPQDPGLFAGSIKDNISRFEAHSGEAPDDLDARVVKAAQAAGAHDLILHLPQGYDTVLGPHGRGLSAGQAQRISLARALYGDPVLVILDEPNAHLDAEGEQALTRTLAELKARGCAVLIIAHRTGVLAHADRLMVLRDGQVELLGPRDEVAARLTGGDRARPRVVSSQH